VVFFGNTVTNHVLTAETHGSQRRWFFCSGGERPPEQKPPPLRGKGFAQASAGDSEAVFYPAASHGRIKENFTPLRPRRLGGEYVIEFMEWHTEEEVDVIKSCQGRRHSKKLQMQGARILRNEAYTDVRCNDER
jgi:hypothetical protein